MTHEYINELLERENENPVLLDKCVLNITDNRSVLYILSGETDYDERELEICYSDNHSDVIWKGIVKTELDLEKIVLENLNS